MLAGVLQPPEFRPRTIPRRVSDDPSETGRANAPAHSYPPAFAGSGIPHSAIAVPHFLLTGSAPHTPARG